MVKSLYQSYPRISSAASKFEAGYIDTSQLCDIKNKISQNEFLNLINISIDKARNKVDEKIINIPEGISKLEEKKIYDKAAKDLINYIKKTDPANAVSQLLNKNLVDVAQEFQVKKDAKTYEMFSGWRNQFLLFECAKKIGRFETVGDVDTSFDIVATIKSLSGEVITLYISLKNRKDTMSGSSVRGVLSKLEDNAKNDKNRDGLYCIIIGCAIDTTRYRSGSSYSQNLEFWPAKLLWEFFSGFTFPHVMNSISQQQNSRKQNKLADELKLSLIKECKKLELINEQNIFHDRKRIIEIFCRQEFDLFQ